MSYFGSSFSKPREVRTDSEKNWFRDKATAWDDRWQALSESARRVYLLEVKPPTREGSSTQLGTLVEKLPAQEVEELKAAGFVRIEPGTSKKSAKVFAVRAAYDFSTRVRAIHRVHLLHKSDRDDLVRHLKYAFARQGEVVIHRTLAKVGINDSFLLEEGLELYVATRRWPDWALESCLSKSAKPVLESIRKAPGPVRLVDLASMVKKVSADEVGKALSELIAHLVVFEDVEPDTLEIVVGLLPQVRHDQANASKPRQRPPLVVCNHPKEVGPVGGLEINDLRVFLLEVAGLSPRLRQDSGIFQKDETRFFEALPDRAGWIDSFLDLTLEARLDRVYDRARSLKFVEVEQDDKTTWLRLSGKGRNWLTSGFEQQYITIYDWYRSTSKKSNRSYLDLDEFHDYSFGDSKFLGVPVSVAPSTGSTRQSYYSYYNDIKPEHRDALRLALWKTFQALPVGVFHRWDSVLDHAVFGEHNPLSRGSDILKLEINIDRRPIPRLPEQVERAGKSLLNSFLKLRLLPFDAVRAAIDGEGKLCVARLERLDGYFGRPYQLNDQETQAATRVIVQPDFSVLVIGLDPSPAAELAPFCERVGGQAGQGILTFKITRDSVIRAAGQGLTAQAIVARLKKLASVDVPENILREVVEWAGWVRLVNIRAVTVIRCPDKETVARVVSALGKKAERLSDTMVALHVAKLTSLERQKLQEQGILVTKQDIAIAPKAPSKSSSPAEAAPSPPRKRGRPRKVR